MTVRPAKTQTNLGICPVWSVFAVRMKKAWVLSYPLSAQWRLIILGRCPGWSESLLGAVALLVSSWGGSNDKHPIKVTLINNVDQDQILDLTWGIARKCSAFSTALVWKIWLTASSLCIVDLPRTPLLYSDPGVCRGIHCFAISSISFNCVHIWTASSEFDTYRLWEQRRFRRACASAQSRQNLRCSLIQAVSQEEPSDRKPDPWPLWMTGHAQLKFVMTECSKTQIRLTGPIFVLNVVYNSHFQCKTITHQQHKHNFCQ